MRPTRVLAIFLPVLISGCCYLFPCHPATYVAGTISDIDSGQAIEKASIHLYRYKTNSTASGCFWLGGADALPFELTISAQGYKPISIKPEAGTFYTNAVLARENSNKSSSAVLKGISHDKYNEKSKDCP